MDIMFRATNKKKQNQELRGRTEGRVCETQALVVGGLLHAPKFMKKNSPYFMDVG
jgi:hypothetical protein